MRHSIFNIFNVDWGVSILGRPQPTSGLDQLLGLDDLKRVAARDIIASRRTGEQFPHTGLLGPGGLGKTTFAESMAHDLRYWFEMIEGAMCKTRKQAQDRLITACEVARSHGRPLLFFIDEVHRLGPEPQEALYYPMLNGTIPGHGPLHKFSLFAATTHPHMLLTPFRSRLVNKWYFDRYTQSTILHMVVKYWRTKNLGYNREAAEMVAQRSLGIPRNAYNLASKVRNEVIACGGTEVTADICLTTFRLEGIDDIGLNRDQVKYLEVLATSPNGTPMGVGGLAGKLDREVVVVEDDIEPVLLSLGYVDRTARGRVLTLNGRLHLNRSGPTGSLKDVG